MRLHRLIFVTVILAVLTLVAVVCITNPFTALHSARVLPLLMAGCLYAAGLFLWSAVWVYILKRANSEVCKKEALAVSMASLFGMLTPMNIGTDVLRSSYGKQRLGLSYHLLTTASILTRTLKIHVTLLLLSLLAIMCLFLSIEMVNLVRAIMGSIISLLVLLILLYLLRLDYSGRIAKRVKLGDISRHIKQTSILISPIRRGVIYLVFATAFALEWLSLHLCFVALRFNPSIVISFVFFAFLYVMSRTPVIPQGFGLVEAGGFAFLRTMNMPLAEIGALLVIWDLLRVIVPVVLALVFAFERRPFLSATSPRLSDNGSGIG